MRCFRGLDLLNSAAEAEGTTVMATTRLASSEKAMVRPMSLNRSRAMPSTNTTGRNTQMVVRVEANSAPATWFTPRMLAVRMGRPSSSRRR